VARLHVLAEPPSIDKGEVTDKGSINQRAVLRTATPLVERCTKAARSDPFLILPPETHHEHPRTSAIVTGGGSGLGEAVARELARQGAKVAVLDINAAGAQRVAADIGGIACTCDVTDTASVTAALDAARPPTACRAS
jgi:predicted Rossmann-fold nucleotide-binding protein